MTANASKLFPCIDCGVLVPCFPYRAARVRCGACLTKFRASQMGEIGRRRSPAVGATAIRQYCGTSYRSVYDPQHPNAPKSGWVLEHRIVMEAMLGRLLSASEVVHHKDHNGLNNAPENLELIASKGQHLAVHHSAEGVAKRLTMYPFCACGAKTAFGESVCWPCWSASQTCPTCLRPGRKMARRDMCHGCYKRLRIKEGRYHR